MPLNIIIPAHHPTIHFQTRRLPLSSCSQLQLPHAIDKKTEVFPYSRMVYAWTKIISLTPYIKSRNRFVPSNWQNHPILGVSRCAITNFRPSNCALAITFISMITRWSNAFTLQNLRQLIILYRHTRSLCKIQSISKLTFGLLFRFGGLIGLLIAWAESDSCTFFTLKQ